MNDTKYDQVPYKSGALHQAHPNHLAALATLFGMKPCDVHNSRILELGCGDGSNLIPMAYGLPESEFIGIDLAANAVSKGQEMISSMGLKNITLLPKDILDVDDEMDLFDYIIVHGIFSWVPPKVQEKILSLCNNNLAAQGVAFVSYNTYPGCHLRGMVRDIMHFHANHFQGPDQKVEQARSILKFITEALPSKEGAYSRVLTEELKGLMELREDMRHSYVYHDYLAEINQPLYFHEFMTRAEKHGLRYLAEADFFEMQDMYFSPDIRETLKRLAGSNIVIKEQFMDFFKGRRFRQTLLHHEEVSLNRRLHPELMRGFYFSCPSRPVDKKGEFLKGEIIELMTREDLMFRRPNGSTLGTDHPIPRAGLLYLSDIWPMPLHFNELLTIAQEYNLQVSHMTGKKSDQNNSKEDSFALCDILMSAFSANMVELHVHAPHFAREPGDHPVASPYARLQAQKTSLVTNLCHRNIDLEKSYGRFILPLLDGSRDRSAMREEMVEIIRSNKLSLNAKPYSEKTTEELNAEIDQELLNCARHALLVA